MLDGLSPDALLQRSTGMAAVVLRLRGSVTVVDRLAQSGAAKAMLPAMHGGVTEVVFLNTSGGLAGGDRIGFAVTLGAGTRACATTQTAERAYRASGAAARVAVTLTVGAGARLDWMPQETILYDRAALDRLTRADVAQGATLMLAEMLVLGRTAMGETVRDLALADRREVWSGGRPVWIDRFGLDGDGLARSGPAMLGGSRALATLVLIGQGAEDALGPVRAALDAAEGVTAAASAWGGRCVIRLTAPSGYAMKPAVARLATVLRRGAALPRVWQM